MKLEEIPSGHSWEYCIHKNVTEKQSTHGYGWHADIKKEQAGGWMSGLWQKGQDDLEHTQTSILRQA